MVMKKYLNKKIFLLVPHAHQAKILKYPQNENFIILQFFMRVQLVFS